MKRIEIMKWNSKDKEGNEVEENTIMALTLLINSKKQEEMPRGIDQFRLFGRLSKAFEKAEKSNTLELEEGDYSFIKKEIETSIPSSWGMNPKISEAIDKFLNPKEE